MEIIFKSVENKEKLLNIILLSNPSKSTNEGFWLFDEQIKKDSNYTAINSGIWNIKYISVFLENKICGLISYSEIYWENDNIREKPIHILGIQTLNEFSGRHLLKEYLDNIIQIAKDKGYDSLTLKPYSKSVKDLYKKYGFKDKNEFMIYGIHRN